MAEEEPKASAEPSKELTNPPVSPYMKGFSVWNSSTVPDKRWKIMLYGPSGSGKTYMAGTFPDPLFLDLEDGMRSVIDMGKPILRYPEDTSATITDLKQVRLFYEMVRKIPPGKAPFKTIVVDSLNELQVLVMKNALSVIDTKRIYEDQPTQGDYGKLARDMSSIVRDFLQLPYHIIMTAAATDREYEEKVFPLFLGKKTGPDLRRITEQIGYCFTQQKDKNSPVEHVVNFGDNPVFSAKDRTKKLGRNIPNNYQSIMKLIKPPKENSQ